ncbi:TIGR02186 family protein [Pararhodospirillum photometricum]|uniref:Transmembrane protein n=1 Tax=Pararhodospirillum photometricum DSM 122 TaxID=1150469 RepID=H6SLJ2_PARPM|nr:TIGR02186 family protein [Pararhodospirillum photometricum]CCG08857.1 Putative uncharacterized protein [Pararhodospirillum photometricum DSM 122]
MRRARAWLVALALGLAVGGRADAQSPIQPLVADLSQHLVAITTAYSGTEVLLFGATDGPGDIVMVVRGPILTHVVRKKDKLGIVWANRESVIFEDVPSFYRVAANRPLEQFAKPEVLSRHQIGTKFLTLPIAQEDTLSPEEQAQFREAFLRLKREAGLYGGDDIGDEDTEPRIQTLSNRLFRVTLKFPANVPVGPYSVEVYLFRDGQVVSAEITPLIISKIGVGADMYGVAMDWPWTYGIVGVIVAVTAGWLAGVLFRK